MKATNRFIYTVNLTSLTNKTFNYRITTMLCPCGSTLSFENCCQRFILSQKPNNELPATAEQLMRSRFSAYATHNGHYIYHTYAKSSQMNQSIEDIQQWAEECIWLGLTIHKAEPLPEQSSNAVSNDANYDYVEFSAYYLHGDCLNEMREKSRFIQEIDGNNNLAWRYLDGEIIKNQELKKIKRNDLCPCNQYHNKQSKKAKKFKHCCGN